MGMLVQILEPEVPKVQVPDHSQGLNLGLGGKDLHLEPETQVQMLVLPPVRLRVQRALLRLPGRRREKRRRKRKRNARLVKPSAAGRKSWRRSFARQERRKLEKEKLGKGRLGKTPKLYANCGKKPS